MEAKQEPSNEAFQTGIWNMIMDPYKNDTTTHEFEKISGNKIFRRF